MTSMGEETRDSALVESESPPAVMSAGPAEKTRGDRARSSGFRFRFAFIYVLLAVLTGFAVGSLVHLAREPEPVAAPNWSEWKPQSGSSRDASVKQIADQVAKRYKLSNGNQLAIALGGPPQVTAGGELGDVKVSAIAVRPDTSKGLAEEGDIQILDASGGIMYILCGLGQNCSIAGGKPSEARHALLRREALELALYTFKYVDDVNSVSVFLPPRPDGDTPPTAVFLRRGDLADELGKPLARSLAPKTPGIGKISQRELAVVDRVTRPNLFNYEYTLAQDNSAILVLTPVGLGA